MSTNGNPTPTGATPSYGSGRIRLAGLDLLIDNVIDAPSDGSNAWMRTTAGVVIMLLVVQFATGALLAFYYVPSSDAAHATTSFVEKAVPTGSWLRALHLHSSQILPLVILLHLAQSFLRDAHRRKPVGWMAHVLLLGLVLANGATGFSLPWDARAFFSTRIAESIAADLPFVGHQARAWLIGDEIPSTLTLSRFYALHILIVPALIILLAVARAFIFRETDALRDTDTNEHATAQSLASQSKSAWMRSQLARNSIVVIIVFVALSLYASRFPAPLGPAPDESATGYLPRPGAQFLWLFQLLKYFSPSAASIIAVSLPALALGALASLPLLPSARRSQAPRNVERVFGVALFTLIFALVGGLTALAVWEDARDPRVIEQLARQAEAEAAFRRAPFEPLRSIAREKAVEGDAGGNGAGEGGGESSSKAVPAAFEQHCARCHGERGEGKSIYPSLVGISSRPNRTFADIVAIINDPASYNLERRMPSFANKLTEEEKRSVAEWVVSLK